jgi:hypothetical protein
MKCSTEESPSEGTEDCWVPPPLLQSFVACKWGGGGVTHLILMPLHFVTARRLNCYICGTTRRVSVVFVTMQGADSTHDRKSRVLVLS